MIRAALALARRGLLVFPVFWPTGGGCACGERCQSPGKHPLRDAAPHGHLDATTDPERVTEWWRRWPLANIGLRTGVESGVLVLDRDDRNGGEAGWEALEAEHGPIPYSVRARTGGGIHVYLRHPGGFVTSLKGVAPGVDLKADGGYVVAPPSLHHSGRRYEWLDAEEARLEDAPGWIADVFGHAAAERLEAPEDVAVALPDEFARALIEVRLLPEFERRIREGEPRNAELVAFGWQLRCNRIPARVGLRYVDALLAACGRSTRDRAVPRSEVARAIVSALRKRPGRPFHEVEETLLDLHRGTVFQGAARAEWLDLCAGFVVRWLDDMEAFAEMAETNEKQCRPPLALDEVREIVRAARTRAEKRRAA